MWKLVTRAWTALFMETSYVARVYGDSLRDNFVSYAPRDPASFAALKAEFDEEIVKPRPYFAELLRIEAALVETMPDDVVKARFWAVDDRFRRVVPLATCDRYDKSVPGRGDACWQVPQFLRDQTRTLLDVVHANYLINIGREKSVKRLKAIISICVVALIFLGLGISRIADGSAMSTGLLLLGGAGIFGSTLSIINRLQTATQVDAMTQDGIYELTGLRVGWVGVLMSFALGGGFALVLYFVVMGGALDIAYPRLNEPAAKQDTITPPSSPGERTTASAGEMAHVPHAIMQPVGGSGGPATEKLRRATAEAMKDSKAPAAPAPPAVTAPAVPPLAATPPADEADRLTKLNLCTGKKGPCVPWAEEVGGALGFADTTSFFKMLILAFLAGFAERLVPDILNRLSKQPSRSS